MSGHSHRRSRLKHSQEESMGLEKEEAGGLVPVSDEDDDAIYEDALDGDGESDKEQQAKEDVLLQLSDPRSLSTRHRRPPAPFEPPSPRVRKRKAPDDGDASEKPHACTHCGRQFAALAAMWGHQARCAARSQNLNLEPHPFDRPKIAAAASGKKFDPSPPPPSRVSHRPKKPTGEEHPCEDCGRVFSEKTRLYGHMSQCAKRLARLGKASPRVGRKSSAVSVTKHEEDEDDEPGTPPGSPEEEIEAPILLRLKRPGASDPPEADGEFVCSECGRGFSSAQALGGHQTSHRKKDGGREEPSPTKFTDVGFQCSVCGLIFATGQALGGHKGSHKPTDTYSEEDKRRNAQKNVFGTGIATPQRRPRIENAVDGGWACDVCGLVFATGQALGGHKGSHKPSDVYSEDEKQVNKRRTVVKTDEPPEAQLKKALVALKKTMQIADAEPFNVPVDAEGLGIPDYLEVVKSPMDLGTIRARLEGNKYPGVEAMLADVRQVSVNCRLYNNDADPIVEMLEVVERRFKSEWVKAGLPLDDQGKPAAPEQRESEEEEGGSDSDRHSSPTRSRRVRFAPGIQSPPLKNRPRDAPTDPAESSEQEQEVEPRRGRGRPPTKPQLKTGTSQHKPNCPCVICKQTRKSPRGRLERDSSDGESDGRRGRAGASHGSDDDEDAPDASEDDAPRQYYEKGAQLRPAQLSPAMWRLGFQLFANSAGAKRQHVKGASVMADVLRTLGESGDATLAGQEADVHGNGVGKGSEVEDEDYSSLGLLSSGARRMGTHDVRAAIAELLAPLGSAAKVN